MKLEVILTFEEDQKMIRGEVGDTILESPQTLSGFILSNVKEEDRNSLIKASCCIIFEENEWLQFPKWYIEANGKLWFKNGKLES